MQGLKTDELVEVLGNEDTQMTRLVFEQDGIPFYVDLPADALQAAMPILIKAATAQGDYTIAIAVVSGAVDLDEAGDVLLTLENTAGARMTFGLPQSAAVQISALLDTALQSQSGSTRSH